uniref:nicotinamidase n=1 Tax=Spongospora subterranea TaxID=70186 RepID=A0A0H5R723_9EUKA|eukprot:CRZ09930.1 hypothetical protein [Spongospora subterranea]
MSKTALIVVDIQNDFARVDGSLSVPHGGEVIPIINTLRQSVPFDLVVLTQDYHPKGHISFYSTHATDRKAKLFQPYQLPDGKVQVLWPDHCVQGTFGAEIHLDLKQEPSDVFIQKGKQLTADSYSAFLDNDRISKTDMEKVLHEHEISRVVIVGLALDYCVGYTALDAKAVGFDVVICKDATKSVHDNSEKQMLHMLEKQGIPCIDSSSYIRSNTF